MLPQPIVVVLYILEILLTIDITKIKTLPESDIWTYSFPCTDLSIAGNQEGLKGKNSSLLYEVLRLLKVSEKPKVLIMENVANLVSEKFIKGFNEWIQLLENEGYKTTWQKMKGCDYEGGTIRNRVFAVSVLGDKSFVFPKKKPTTKVIRDYLEPFDNDFYVDESFDFSCEKKFNNGYDKSREGRGCSCRISSSLIY